VAWAMGALLLYGWFERKNPIALEWGGYLRYAGSAAAMAVIVFIVARAVDRPIGQFLLGGCAAGIAYVFLLWIQRDLALQGLVRILRQRSVG
jgi:peptidoglycan biosynthesis protein MviN/MurJ (putative lipid II flippase)